MKVGIDGAPATIPFPCGTKHYAQKLLQSLAEIDKENEYVVFAAQKVNLPKQANFSLVGIPQILPVLKRQLFLAKAVEREQIDVMHYLEPYGAYFLSHPKIVTTVHDINLDDTYPWISNKWLTRAYCEMTRHGVLRRSKVCICVSRTIADETRKYLSTIGSRAKVLSIYQGVDNDFMIGGKMNTKGEYFLTMGDFTPRKNVKKVIDAYGNLPQKLKDKYRLKIVVSSTNFVRQFEEHVALTGVNDRVDILVNVTKEKLIALYSSAIAFLYPSLYEGFGLPILEAMASGCPVITTNWGVMKEVAGNASLLIDSNSLQDMCLAMESMSVDSDLRKKMIDVGIKRVRRFSWVRTAKETLKVYRRLANE